jgi:O-antigen ligase
MAGLIFVGCYFTYTRSAMPAIGVGLAAMALSLRGLRRTVIIGALIGVVLIFPLLENTGLVAHRFYRDAEEDRSAASHEAAWQVGLAIALDHPLYGIGHERYSEFAPEYIEVVAEDTSGIGGTLSLESGTAEPHNDFLNVWFSWGIGALLAYVALYIGALRNCAVAARSPDLLIRGMAIGTAGGLIAYAANSMLHNYMDSNAYLWIYAGLSVALVRLASLPPPMPTAHVVPHDRR